MRHIRIILPAWIMFSFLALSGTVYALPIEQNVVDSYGQINHFGPVGQSFVAEDSFVTADLWITEYNQHIDPTDYDISYYLYEGTGSSGALIGGGTYSGLTDDYAGWVEFDLSMYSLNVGSTYSVMVYNDNARWGFGFTQSDLYSGGQLLLSQDPNNSFPGFDQYDAAFRINPTTASVPEPSSVALVLLGIAGAGAASRRRSKK